METHYSVIGVSQSASQEEIKRTYLRLAQKYHPDRHINPEEKKKANEQFAKITASYRVLSDENARAAYDKSFQEGKGPKDEAKETQAKNAFTRAMAFLKQNDPWRAVNLLRITCRYDPQPLYLSYLGLALVYTKQYRREGFEKLKAAISQMMFNPALYVNLALAHEFLGNKSEAHDAFKEALNWDAHNRAARKGIERTKQKKKGLLGGLFGG